MLVMSLATHLRLCQQTLRSGSVPEVVASPSTASLSGVKRALDDGSMRQLGCCRIELVVTAI